MVAVAQEMRQPRDHVGRGDVILYGQAGQAAFNQYRDHHRRQAVQREKQRQADLQQIS